VSVAAVYAGNSLFFGNYRDGRPGMKASGKSGQAAAFAQFIPQDVSHENMLLQMMMNQPPMPAISNTPGIFLESDRPILVERTRRAFGLNDRDEVQVFVIPRDQRRRRGFQTGSFIYRPTTSRRTERLNRSIIRTERLIRELEMDKNNNDECCEKTNLICKTDKPDREIHLLRMRLIEYQQRLTQERRRLANGPRRGWIVVEREE